MRYKKFGNTGIEISALGFGAMRLPEYEKDGKWYMDEEKSIELLRYGFNKGINYYDTAYVYSHENNEALLGKAFKDVRDKIYISTKLPTWKVKCTDDFMRFLYEQLERLDTEYIDFFHMHSLDDASFENIVMKYKLIDEAEKAKSKGLIKHISFSFHDKPEIMKKIIDTKAFESVLCQYNLLDNSNAEAIDYAKENGLGVIVMGPIGGGTLATSNNVFNIEFGGTYGSTQEIALRYVLSNTNIDCALSGMNTMEMINENAQIASDSNYLNKEDMNDIIKLRNRTKELADLYCTGCNYCQPCPQNIKIPAIFKYMNMHKVYKTTESAKSSFKEIGKNEWSGKHPDNCSECGECEEKCPQNIKIIEQLKECTKELS